MFSGHQTMGMPFSSKVTLQTPYSIPVTVLYSVIKSLVPTILVTTYPTKYTSTGVPRTWNTFTVADQNNRRPTCHTTTRTTCFLSPFPSTTLLVTSTTCKSVKHLLFQYIVTPGIQDRTHEQPHPGEYSAP